MLVSGRAGIATFRPPRHDREVRSRLHAVFRSRTETARISLENCVTRVLSAKRLLATSIGRIARHCIEPLETVEALISTEL